MMLMPANHSSQPFRDLVARYPGRLGWLVGPSSILKTKLRTEIPFALDNDAYSAFKNGTPWSEAEWLRMLNRVEKSGFRPLWAIVPDVVGNREATLTLWGKYVHEVNQRGWMAAFAVQDGMTPDDVPKGADVVFVGGTTIWKWRTMPTWTKHFPHVHVGRVNELRRVWSCEEHGVKSVDGSGWFKKTHTGRMGRNLIHWLEGGRDNNQDLPMFAAKVLELEDGK